MQPKARRTMCFAARLSFAMAAASTFVSVPVRAEVKAQTKRAVNAIKRGAHDTAKAAAPVGTTVAHGTKKGVTAIKRAGVGVGNAVRGR